MWKEDGPARAARRRRRHQTAAVEAQDADLVLRFTTMSATECRIGQGRLNRVEEGSCPGTGRFHIAKAFEPDADGLDVMIAAGVFQLPPGQHGHSVVKRHILDRILGLYQLFSSNTAGTFGFVGGERYCVGLWQPSGE